MKLNIVGENDDYKYFGSVITKIIVSIGFFILLSIFVSYFMQMLNYENDINYSNLYTHRMENDNEFLVN
jgi:hypothetical protein